MATNNSRRFFVSVLAILMIIIVISCSKIISSPQTSVSSNTVIYTTTTTYTQRITEGIFTEITQSVTRTISPYLTTSTPISTKQQNYTVEEAKNLLLKLLETNGNCEFPCIWGQIPGKTEISIMDTFFNHFGAIEVENDFLVSNKNEQGKYTDINFGLWKNNSGIFSVTGITFAYPRINDDSSIFRWSATASTRSGEGVNEIAKVVYGDSDFNQLLEYYMLQRILTDYGEPTQVYIEPFLDNQVYPPDYVIPFHLIIYYQGKGFYIEYILPRETMNNHYMGCPSKTGYILLKTWVPETYRSLEDVIGFGSTGISGIESTKTINESTSFTLNEFFEKYKESNNKDCIETPINMWSMK